jgi:hypothetical protein
MLAVLEIIPAEIVVFFELSVHDQMNQPVADDSGGGV